SARFHDQDDNGCHMSPGRAGAPASGANGAGGNQASCTNCQSQSGISRWWINSPYENLHIADEPLSYFTSSGQPMVFRWLYKQRYKLPELDEVPYFFSKDRMGTYVSNPYQLYMRTYGMTNASWSHNWMLDVLFWNTTWEVLPPGSNPGQQRATPVFGSGYEAMVF